MLLVRRILLAAKRGKEKVKEESKAFLPQNVNKEKHGPRDTQRHEREIENEKHPPSPPRRKASCSNRAQKAEGKEIRPVEGLPAK